MKKVCVGIDIGGTNSVFGIADKEGNILAEGGIKTVDFPNIDDYVAKMSDGIQKTIDKLGDVELVGIGIGAPNANYNKGTVEHAPNLAWEGVVPLADLFKANFNKPVAVTNDANAAAIGEQVYGGGKNMKNFVFITLGTGLGSGIIVNGELVYGHDGFAGEMGHVNVMDHGRKCNCGKRGCLETYVSATGIKRTAFELMADSVKPSPLKDIPFNKLESKDIYEAAIAGDPIAKQAFERTGKILGKALADTVAYLSPEAIFLFGGLAKAGDLIFKPTQKAFGDNLMRIFTVNKTKILFSELNNKNAAILGSAALAWKESEK